MLIRRYYSCEKKQNISNMQILKPVLDCAAIFLSLSILSICRYCLLVVRFQQRKTFYLYDEKYSTRQHMQNPFADWAVQKSLLQGYNIYAGSVLVFTPLTESLLWAHSRVFLLIGNGGKRFFSEMDRSAFRFPVQAQESTFVFQNMHRWIYLVWRKWERGSDAISTMNTFGNSLYFNPEAELK